MQLIDIKKKVGNRGKVPMPSADELAEQYQIHTVSELAKIYGVTINTVRTWLYRYRHSEKISENAAKLLSVRKPRGVKNTAPPEEELAKLYMEHTVREIAEIYNVSSDTVSTWIYNYRQKARAKAKLGNSEE